MQHILAVAQKLRSAVEQEPDRYPCSPEEAYVLGYLHDVGYAFASEQRAHGTEAGLLLKEQGYPYWREIYYHGAPQEEYNSPLLTLLNYTDMTTGPAGEDWTIEQRLADIAVRYGDGSI